MRYLQPVTSSCVAAIGYDGAAGVVYVEFIDSGTYAYWPVPDDVWRGFLAADSKGTFVNEVLKQPRYQFRKA
jgi:KTSC domain-containing protein